MIHFIIILLIILVMLYMSYKGSNRKIHEVNNVMVLYIFDLCLKVL